MLFHYRPIVLCAGVFAVFFSSGPESSAELKEARLTQIIKDVNILPISEKSRPAKVGDSITGKTAVSTGRRSRAELEFQDKTLLRLGSSTHFSIKTGTRTIQMQRGSVLLQTSPSGGRVNIRTGSVTAVVSGSLGAFAIAPGNTPGINILKFISFYGTMQLEVDGMKDPIILQPWQMLIWQLDVNGRPAGRPQLVSIDIMRLMASSQLFNGFVDSSLLDPEKLAAQISSLRDQKGNNQWTAVDYGQVWKLPRNGTTITGGQSALQPPHMRPMMPAPTAPMMTPTRRRPP